MTFKFKPGVSSSEVLNAIRGAALKNAYNVNQVSENSISVQAGMFTYSADTIQEANSTVLIMNQKPAPAVAVVMILLLLFFIVPGIIFLTLLMKLVRLMKDLT